MIQVKNGKVLSTTLPKNGFLKNGRAVSNYDKLPIETLEQEGWLEPKEVKPTLTKNQEFGSTKYELQKDKWVKTYDVLQKPVEIAPDPDPLEEIRDRLTALEGVITCH